MSEAVAPLRRLAPEARPIAGAVCAFAKINLALHVTGRREDGYHLLDSLVAFATDGDGVAIAPAERDGLRVTGPFAASVPAGEENILWKALALARRHGGAGEGPLAIHLDKRLPVASGIGGGSADAAALLRLLSAGNPALRAALAGPALSIGADVPMCLFGTPCRIGGIGEAIEPLGAFPETAAVLVNPGGEVSTPAVFRGLDRRDNPPLPAPPPAGFGGTEALVAYLKETRNDLEAPALAIAPAVAAATEALRSEGALFARMSGSGATVFGLFRGPGEAARAAAAITRGAPGWWVTATTLRSGAEISEEPA